MSYFAPFCAGHGSRVLLGDRQIDALRPAAGGGLAIEFTCFCGWAGTLEPDGRTRLRADTPEPSARPADLEDQRLPALAAG